MEWACGPELSARGRATVARPAWLAKPARHATSLCGGGRVTGLVSYGGDPAIIASIDEIERSRSTLELVQQRLLKEFELLDFLVDPVARTALALHAPVLLARLEKLKWAAGVASDAYLSAEARITKQLDWVTSAVAKHPWLLNVLPNQLRAALPAVLVAGSAAATLVDGKAARLIARETLNMWPALTAGQKSSGQDSAAAASMVAAWAGANGRGGRTGVAVESVGAFGMRAAPTSIGAVAERLAETHLAEEPTVVIERYTDGTRSLFVAYLPGMRSLEVGAGSEPFDLGSSLQQLANPDAAVSQAAVEAALAAAGVKPTDELVVAGYSQGGMVAGALASGVGGFNVSAIVTLGAPIAQLELPQETAVMAIEHSNDVVPALSGAINPLTENWVTVGREIDLRVGESALNSHELETYVETSKLVDKDDSVGVTRIRETVLRKFEGLRLVETQTFELKPIDG